MDNLQIEGILPKGPYLPCVSMAGRALLAGYVEINPCSIDQCFDWYMKKKIHGYDETGECESCLTHLPLDEMAAIWADGICNCIFLSENFRILIQISLKYVPRSPIDNKPVLVWVMACHRSGESYYLDQLEQLECLHCEIPPAAPWLPITHNSDSHQIPSQNKTKSKSQI